MTKKYWTDWKNKRIRTHNMYISKPGIRRSYCLIDYGYQNLLDVIFKNDTVYVTYEQQIRCIRDRKVVTLNSTFVETFDRKQVNSVVFSYDKEMYLPRKPRYCDEQKENSSNKNLPSTLNS